MDTMDVTSMIEDDMLGDKSDLTFRLLLLNLSIFTHGLPILFEIVGVILSFFIIIWYDTNTSFGPVIQLFP